MVWYQKFEYAVSHWLQKAAEDKFGCVLCSPGCFSLFRGWSLMDENVMNRYTTPPSEARHYVQYDQGKNVQSAWFKSPIFLKVIKTILLFNKVTSASVYRKITHFNKD